MSKASERIANATTTIVLDHPFFATLLLQMPRIEDDSIPTACTDGVVIKYNPKFIESLTDAETAGLLAHEVLHPALGHLHRLPPDKEGNIAGDYAINNFLDNYNRDAGCRKLSLPKGGCLDHKYDGMSAEEILADLRRNQSPKPQPQPQGDKQDGDQQDEQQGGGDPQPNDKSDGKGKGGGGDKRTEDEGGWGEFEQQSATDDVSQHDMATEWERRLVQAATVCKMQGKLPGCVEALVGHLLNPKIPWHQLLERFFDATSHDDYSWRKPDRRFLPDDIIIPDLYDDTLGHVVIAVDTSGSIFGSPEAVESFQSEINAILERAKPSKTTVIYCDAAVQHVDEYTDANPITITPRGGGGTDFRPVGDYIRQHNIDPRVVIYLTDLYGTFPDNEWPFPTIWCSYNNPDGQAPFGETIAIN
jgi:predicted metal-dependent peptidase